MKCQVCNKDAVKREVTQDFCYSKECICKECGAVYIQTTKGLLLIETEVMV